ncbi:hypothetical protein BDA96_10G095000 [Sorghum bicolor]|uniref:Uncharacterized protein n=1 Tax=Sorghum bicolor TaxID=4558 RepID=A0A921U0E7_SORBI|nr:hypothetical protein BDA96_10G095000 [Sorghum bicolor]
MVYGLLACDGALCYGLWATPTAGIIARVGPRRTLELKPARDASKWGWFNLGLNSNRSIDSFVVKWSTDQTV